MSELGENVEVEATVESVVPSPQVRAAELVRGADPDVLRSLITLVDRSNLTEKNTNLAFRLGSQSLDGMHSLKQRELSITEQRVQLESEEIAFRNKSQERRYIFATLALMLGFVFSITAFLVTSNQPNILAPILSGMCGLFTGALAGYAFGAQKQLGESKKSSKEKGR